MNLPFLGIAYDDTGRTALNLIAISWPIRAMVKRAEVNQIAIKQAAFNTHGAKCPNESLTDNEQLRGCFFLVNLALSLSFVCYPCLSNPCLCQTIYSHRSRVREETRRNFKFATGMICDVIGSRALAMAAHSPRSASPDYPPPAPPRQRLSIPCETGNTRLLPPGAEGNSQHRAQTLERVHRKVPPSEAPRKIHSHASLRSPTRPKTPIMSIVAEPTTKIKVADLVENCRYSGWVRKQGGSYKSCEFIR